ncbi:hypothetical protein DEJ15_01745 [Curtobacterium sp. MCJR17_043]|nr:hypothetical protein [Curtobacterium sp. MCJR17_043]WIB36034.1 hypothetical protein DEJ15_01745 [Curtobacterium sp. MCJR17_043]
MSFSRLSLMTTTGKSGAWGRARTAMPPVVVSSVAPRNVLDRGAPPGQLRDELAAVVHHQVRQGGQQLVEVPVVLLGVVTAAADHRDAERPEGLRRLGHGRADVAGDRHAGTLVEQPPAQDGGLRLDVDADADVQPGEHRGVLLDAGREERHRAGGPVDRRGAGGG